MLTILYFSLSDHIWNFISSSVHCIFNGDIDGLCPVGGMEPRTRMAKGLPVLSNYRQLMVLRMMTLRVILKEKGLICIFIYLKYCHFEEGIKGLLEVSRRNNQG